MEKVKQIKISVKHASCLCTFYNNGKANVMIIDSVLVEENYRNQGIGAILLKKAVKSAIARKIDSIELIVNDDNTNAKNLYKKIGFEKTNKEHHRIILNKKK